MSPTPLATLPTVPQPQPPLLPPPTEGAFLGRLAVPPARRGRLRLPGNRWAFPRNPTRPAAITGGLAWALILLLLLTRPSLAASRTAVEFSEGRLWGTVRTVVDGRRITVVTPDLVRLDLRLAGLELPERARTGIPGAPDLPGQPFGEVALSYLRDLILDRLVRLDTYGRDASRRLLGVVWLGDISVNLALVKEGLAWVDPAFAVTKVRAGLEVAERQAQVGRYGLWVLPDPEPPWEYRKRHGLGSRRSP